MILALDGCFDSKLAETQYRATLREHIRQNLSAFERRGGSVADKRIAAVAVVVTSNEADQACFVLTKRAESLRRHGGQWALPGGGANEGETA